MKPDQLKNISDSQSVILAIEENFKAKVTFLPRQHTGMKVLQEAATTYVDSLTSSDTFNCAFGGNFQSPNALKVANQIRRYYQESKSSVAWWVGPSSDVSSREAVLHEAGFSKNEMEIGMAALLSEMKLDVKIPEGMTIQQVSSSDQMRDFGRVLASVFTPFDQDVVRFYEMISQCIDFTDRHLPARYFVGYVYGQPVTTGGLFCTEKTAGVYDIATHPLHRKKGYGTVMTAVALNAARDEGYDVVTLQASQDGINIYRALGFKSFCEFHVYGIAR